VEYYFKKVSLGFDQKEMNYLLTMDRNQAGSGFGTLEADDFDTWLGFFKDPRSNKYWAMAPEEPGISMPTFV